MQWDTFESLDHPKYKAAYVDPGNPGLSQPKRDIHCQNAMLWIWWNQKVIVYYELLNTNETVTAGRYRRQLGNLACALDEKRTVIANKNKVVLYDEDEAKSQLTMGNIFVNAFIQSLLETQKFFEINAYTLYKKLACY